MSVTFSQKVETLINNTRVVDEDLQNLLKYLSTFYKSNTEKNRGELRNMIEEKNLKTFEEMERNFKRTYDKLCTLRKGVEKLDNSCKLMVKNLDEHEKLTKDFSTQVQSLIKKKNENIATKNEYDDFLTRYQLTDKQRQILISGNVESENFFHTLNKVYDIHQQCVEMLRSQHFKAPLEIMSEMSMYQNAAYDRLSRWIQEKCHYSDLFFEEKLKMAISTLFSRPVLLKSCISEIVEARKIFIRQDFFDALTTKERPLVLKAHDSLRYIADILAWTHQHVASEKEMIQFLFSTDEKGRGGKITLSSESEKNKIEKKQIVVSMVNEIFRVLIGPIGNNISQLFSLQERTKISKSEGKERILEIYFKLSHLLEFYGSSMLKFLKFDGPEVESKLVLGNSLYLVEFFNSMKEKSMKKFYELVSEELKYLHECELSLSSIQTEASGNIEFESDFPLPKQLRKILQKLTKIMLGYSSSIIDSRRRDEDYEQVLDLFLTNIVNKVERIIGIQKTEDEITVPLDLDEEAVVFLINSYCTILTVIKSFGIESSVAFIRRWEKEMSEKLDTNEQLYIKKESANLINKFGFLNKLKSVKLWKEQKPEKEEGEKKLSEMKDFAPDEIRKYVQVFYSKLYQHGVDLLIPSKWKSIENSKIRSSTRTKILLVLANSYEVIFNAVHDERAGYTNPLEIAFHTPQQIKTLLEL